MKYIEADSKTLCLHFSILKTKRSSVNHLQTNNQNPANKQNKKNTHQQPYDETAKINNIK
jgi:hypothetical protein